MPRHFVIPHKGTSLYTQKELGRGQFGVARLVKTEKGQTYCLKEVCMKGKSDTTKEQAMEEVHLMTMAKEHPNIIRYFDHWFDLRSMYILMEYAPNGSLDTMISKHREEGRYLTEMQVLHNLQQLASALSFLHDEARMMHRDLKPENVLVGQYGELKLADFGLSKALSPDTNHCQTFVGSPLYMSPELCSGEEYTFSTDIWAVGCIVYEMMALHSPWEFACNGTIPGLMKVISTSPADFSPLSRYSEKVIKTVKWMLRKTASTRPTASSLVHLLEMKEPPVSESVLRETIDIRNAVRGNATPPRQVTVSLCLEEEEVEEMKLEAEEDVVRRAAIIKQAAQLAGMEANQAAATIQKSFRSSFIRRRGVFSPHPSIVQEKKLLPKPRQKKIPPPPASKYADLHAKDISPPVAHETANKIQIAMRTSLNRRRAKAGTPPPPLAPGERPTPAFYRPKPLPAPASKVNKPTPYRPSSALPPCSSRLEKLAIPRPHARAAPFRVNKGNPPPLPPVKAWN